MGRLIDEDMLMERLGFLNTPQEREENAGQIITLEDFDSIPTAYDVDKVVEELEENASRYTKKYVTPYGNNGYRDTKAISVNKVTEIVKQGVVSDDVCEYRITDKVVYASCNNKQIASAFCWHNECGDYKYCPYCSKKIKILDNDK